ncbi:hypothetical protein ACWOC1_09820 [Enterococcus quebecensis]|uniref:Uncharacterized protein n=1 Tax=Enterococcus quebecensis TaxID=903983 RepID=A0A1E5GTA0_9ENTE|nr:hypothetical protein [Enterococcus quebecensis]OEG15907.1 hypothetical protein BCR23_07095 [Enterococcus quebecensis]
MNELVMPNNYVELTNEEMMYLEGSGFFKKAWKWAKKAVSTGIKVVSTVKGIIGAVNTVSKFFGKQPAR